MATAWRATAASPRGRISSNVGAMLSPPYSWRKATAVDVAVNRLEVRKCESAPPLAIAKMNRADGSSVSRWINLSVLSVLLRIRWMYSG